MTSTNIINAVTQVFPVLPADLTGPRRRRNEADARHCAIYLIHRQLRMSNRQVAAVFGRYCGSTTCSSRRRFAALYATDNQYRSMVDRVAELLGITLK